MVHDMPTMAAGNSHIQTTFVNSPRTVKRLNTVAPENSQVQTTFINSPRTVKRLNAASSKLKQYAGKVLAKEVEQACIGKKPNDTVNETFHQIGCSNKDDTVHSQITNSITTSHAPSMPSVISYLRRNSLTGSLPDLNNAYQSDIQGDLFLLSPALIKRPPLPHGSKQFEQVLEEQKDEMGEKREEEESVLKIRLRELRKESNEDLQTPRQRFRSKTAEALYFTNFGQCFPKYWSKIRNKENQEQMGGSQDCLHLPELYKTNSKHVSWGEVGVNIFVPGGRLHKSMPNSPHTIRKPNSKKIIATLSPSFGSQEGTCTSIGSSSPEDSQSGSPNPSQTGSSRTSLDRMPLARAESQTACPRLLRRRQTPHVLCRTKSHD